MTRHIIEDTNLDKRVTPGIAPSLRSLFYACTAKQLLHRLKDRTPIVTFSQKLDILLSGGVLPSGGIYEICGQPGSGKTQLCMQVALNVQIPSVFFGCAKRSWYIDTEGSFSPYRCRLMAQGVCDHLFFLSKLWNTAEARSTVSLLSPDHFMEGILFTRVFDEVELLTLISVMDHVILKSDGKPPIGLIIIDSISFPFRASFGSSSTTRCSDQLTTISNALKRISLRHNIAIVCTNQMTLRLTPVVHSPMHLSDTVGAHDNPDFKAAVVPCLGSVWESMCSVILFIEIKQKRGTRRRTRQCSLHTANTENRAADMVWIQITDDGIRDVTADDDIPEVND